MPRYSAQHARGGFSLIEILVVISLIALLSGIAYFAATSLRGQGEVEQTRAVVQALAGIPEQYLAVTDRPLQYTGNYTDEEGKKSIRFLIEKAQGIPAAKQMLQTMQRDFYIVDPADPDDITKHYIVDAWGNPLRFSHFEAGDDHYGDDTVGMPHRRTPYVASAGPDGEWGIYAGNAPDAQAEDNLYSFDLSY